MYKISIIIPVYNVEDTLENAFNSIKNQNFDFKKLELIFIDDCSTDNSVDILKKLSKDYVNVKTFFLDKNSGFAGKPRNIGIQNATADYLMFLDPDDVYLENACSLLYENITKNQLDIVSANFNYITYNEKTVNKWNEFSLSNNEIEINSIEEEPNLFSCNPAIWTKIYKKKFIVDNNIYFDEDLPAEDLIFNARSLLKANGIKFINVPIVDYSIRYEGNNKSKSATRTKNLLLGYLKAYKKLYLLFINTEYVKFAVKPLYFWTKQLILSNLPIQEKINLLIFAKPLYDKFKMTDLKLTFPFKPFFEKIYRKDYLGALNLSKKLSLNFDNESHYFLLEKIKNKKIFFLFWGLEEDIGGLAKTVCNRANLLQSKGYKISLLNNGPLKNFKFIISKYKKLGYLNNSIEVINIFDYYSKKNTLNVEKKSIKQYKKNNNDYISKKIKNSDESITIEYFDGGDIKECSIKNKIVEELYFEDYLALKKIFKEGRLIKEYYYTIDSFNYFYIDHVNNEFILFNREDDYYLTFDNFQEFEDYFFTEICLNTNEKPFLINDCSGPTPSIKNISSDITYKIGVVHNNPYLEPYCFGSKIGNIASLCDYKYEDAVVVLTQSAKKDFENQFKYNNFVVIPHFVTNEDIRMINNQKITKENNVVSIFARTAPEKNLEDIIKAFNLVLNKYPNAILKIYGRSLSYSEVNEKNKLENLINELNVSESIKFMGHVENAYEEMSKSLLIVLTSHIEGLPMVIIEGMLNSTPVISYDVNYGPKDVIIDGVNGFLVNQYDIVSLSERIIQLLDNPDKAN